jgi:hypothetical protein
MAGTLIRKRERHHQTQYQPSAFGAPPNELVKDKQDDHRENASMPKIGDIREKSV